jgi:hypothetical protein
MAAEGIQVRSEKHLEELCQKCDLVGRPSGSHMDTVNHDLSLYNQSVLFSPHFTQHGRFDGERTGTGVR